ncbi:hypothetical protein BDK51DRAFT_46887, partial [Blyttiomyces helicus]
GERFELAEFAWSQGLKLLQEDNPYCVQRFGDALNKYLRVLDPYDPIYIKHFTRIAAHAETELARGPAESVSTAPKLPPFRPRCNTRHGQDSSTIHDDDPLQWEEDEAACIGRTGGGGLQPIDENDEDDFDFDGGFDAEEHVNVRREQERIARSRRDAIERDARRAQLKNHASSLEGWEDFECGGWDGPIDVHFIGDDEDIDAAVEVAEAAAVAGVVEGGDMEVDVSEAEVASLAAGMGEEMEGPDEELTTTEIVMESDGGGGGNLNDGDEVEAGTKRRRSEEPDDDDDQPDDDEADDTQDEDIPSSSNTQPSSPVAAPYVPIRAPTGDDAEDDEDAEAAADPQSMSARFMFNIKLVQAFMVRPPGTARLTRRIQLENVVRKLEECREIDEEAYFEGYLPFWRGFYLLELDERESAKSAFEEAIKHDDKLPLRRGIRAPPRKRTTLPQAPAPPRLKTLFDAELYLFYTYLRINLHQTSGAFRARHTSTWNYTDLITLLKLPNPQAPTVADLARIEPLRYGVEVYLDGGFLPQAPMHSENRAAGHAARLILRTVELELALDRVGGAAGPLVAGASGVSVLVGKIREQRDMLDTAITAARTWSPRDFSRTREFRIVESCLRRLLEWGLVDCWPPWGFECACANPGCARIRLRADGDVSVCVGDVGIDEVEGQVPPWERELVWRPWDPNVDRIFEPCSECGIARYCSEACKVGHAAVHARFCKHVVERRGLAKATYGRGGMPLSAFAVRGESSCVGFGSTCTDGRGASDVQLFVEDRILARHVRVPDVLALPSSPASPVSQQTENWHVLRILPADETNCTVTSATLANLAKSRGTPRQQARETGAGRGGLYCLTVW